jgi:hypothetical protein
MKDLEGRTHPAQLSVHAGTQKAVSCQLSKSRMGSRGTTRDGAASQARNEGRSFTHGSLVKVAQMRVIAAFAKTMASKGRRSKGVEP